MERNDNKGLANVETHITAFTDFGNMNALIEYCKPLCGSGLHDGTPAELASKVLFACGLGIKPERVFAIAKRLMIIKNQIVADVQLMQALVRKANILYETIEDGIQLFQYTANIEFAKDGTITKQGITLSHDECYNNPKIAIYFTPAHYTSNVQSDLDKGVLSVIRNKTFYDIRTKIKFTRIVGNSSVIEYGIFSYNDAVSMELTTKDNWKKMPRQMLYARASSLGIRRIAPDVVNGLYTADEMNPDIPYQEKEYTSHEDL